MSTAQLGSMAELTTAVRGAAFGPAPEQLVATSVFWVQHGTRLAGGDTTYRNQYVLVRVGEAFGACAFEAGEVDAQTCVEASGVGLDILLEHRCPAVRIAALDAYLAAVRPHRDSEAERVTLPAGPPEVRARARDAAIAALLEVRQAASVALIGVVNPLVAAIRDRGARCLPCDLNLRQTQWGDRVTATMSEVLDAADAVVATGMTLGNGTFDELLRRCRERRLPLIMYAQTGSALARAFLGSGVHALSAEPFPFSQFSAEETVLYRYRQDSEGTVRA